MQVPPDHERPLVPEKLDVAPVTLIAERRQWLPRALAIALTVLLIFGVVAVFVLLPRWIPPSTLEATSSAPTTTPRTAPAPPESTPLTAPASIKEPNDTSLLFAEPPEARAAAQDALAALLPKFDALRSQRVEEWGKTEFAAATAAMAAGEKAYREQRYTQARAAYADVDAKLTALAARLPEVVADYIDAGDRALLSQDPRAAETAFSKALALAPDNAAARRGLKRAENFDQVLALLTEAKGYERMNQPQRAASTYRAVLALDPEAAEARLALTRIDGAQAERLYRTRMSEGFRALEQGDFSAARTAFAAASKLKPRATEAANALAQTEARAAAAKIDSALASAARAENAEQWSEAAAQYRAALSVDKALPNAAAGAARADQRAGLARRLEEALKDPARLADEGVYREAESVLNTAKAVASPGPKLRQQIAALHAQMTDSRRAVPVRVISDSDTDVTILKYGRLGAFADQTLSLRPGRYTAVGKRNGYRDTRIEFTVAPDATPTITVRCEEALSFGR
jgi:hypothetical protein